MKKILDQNVYPLSSRSSEMTLEIILKNRVFFGPSGFESNVLQFTASDDIPITVL